MLILNSFINNKFNIKYLKYLKYFIKNLQIIAKFGQNQLKFKKSAKLNYPSTYYIILNNLFY